MLNELRLFIAIAIPKAIRADMQRNLLSRDVFRIAGIRPVQADNLHLTLHFFGDTPVAKLPVIRAVLQQTASQFEPFEIEIGGAGVFPNRRAPRVIWCGLEPRDALTQLASELRKELKVQGFTLEAKKFQAHLTLARVRTYAAPIDETVFESLLKTIDAYPRVSFLAEEIHCYSSDLTGKFPVYSLKINEKLGFKI